MRRLVAVIGLCSACARPQGAAVPSTEQLAGMASGVLFSEGADGVELQSFAIESLSRTFAIAAPRGARLELRLYRCPVETLISLGELAIRLPPAPDNLGCRDGGAPCPDRRLSIAPDYEEVWSEDEGPPVPRPWPEARPSPCRSFTLPAGVTVPRIAPDEQPVFSAPIGAGPVLVSSWGYYPKVEGVERDRYGQLSIWVAGEGLSDPPRMLSTTTGTQAWLAGASLPDGTVTLWGDSGATATARLIGEQVELTPGPRYPWAADHCHRRCLRDECETQCVGSTDPDCVEACLRDPGRCAAQAVRAKLIAVGDQDPIDLYAATECRTISRRRGAGPWTLLRATEAGEFSDGKEFDLLWKAPDELYAAGVYPTGVLRFQNGEFTQEGTEDIPLETTALAALDGQLYAGVREQVTGAYLFQRRDRAWSRLYQLGAGEPSTLLPIEDALLVPLGNDASIVQVLPNGVCREERFQPRVASKHRTMHLLTHQGRIWALLKSAERPQPDESMRLEVFAVEPAPPACTKLTRPAP